MLDFNKLKETRRILGLGEEASLAEIRGAYHPSAAVGRNQTEQPDGCLGRFIALTTPGYIFNP
ncbi:MAG: hypothetical protein QME81_20245 [bacterium]|nr:hypothetical protein [bacterium]